MIESEVTYYMMNREVNSMIEVHGMALDEACRIIGLPESARLPEMTQTVGYIPTPADIEAACEEIRKGWSPIVTNGRNMQKRSDRRVEVQVVSAGDFGEAVLQIGDDR